MKQRHIKRSKASNGDLHRQSQKKRQGGEYSDIQGKRMKQCVKIAFLITATAIAFTLIYFSFFTPPADIAIPMM
jgi:hypothetical protein